jgi:hypothetical protein
MKPESYKYSLLILLLIMAGCNNQNGISNTSTPALSATAAISWTPTLHFTVTPSWTLSPSDLTLENFRSTTWAALEARNVKCKGGFQLELPMDILRYSNKDWTLFTCSPPPPNNREGKGAQTWPVDYGTRYTQLIKTDLSQSWVIQHDSFNYSEMDRPDALLVPFRWTEDGKYLYVYPDYYPGPSGGSASRILRTGVSSLYRINLENGDFGPATPNNHYSSMEISPDDRFLVYSDWDEPDRIHVWNLESAKDMSVKLNQDVMASGGFVWNSKSEIVVFVAAQGSDDHESREDMAGTSVFVLTIENMNVEEILSEDPRLFIPADCFDGNYWLDENTMCLYSINDNLDSWNKYFSINIKTREVIFVRSFP